MELKYGSKFKRGMKVMLKRGCDPSLLAEALEIRMAGEQFDSRYRDHVLSGDYEGYRECHIQADWLLIYRIDGDCLRLWRTGSHSDLFE